MAGQHLAAGTVVFSSLNVSAPCPIPLLRLQRTAFKTDQKTDLTFSDVRSVLSFYKVKRFGSCSADSVWDPVLHQPEASALSGVKQYAKLLFRYVFR